MNIKNVRFIKFPTFTDIRGSVSEVEFKKVIPFKVERTFHIFNVQEGKIRGTHAHIKNEQVYACLNGSVTITLDDGVNQTEVVLKDPSEGLYVGSMVWHTIKNFSSQAVFCVWNSRPYEKEDLISNYDKFLKEA